jgi:3',5'-cyclic-nucleotide phosphodiesterase
MKTIKPEFICIPLGAEGGLVEGNLSAYLMAAAGTSDFVCLDAGTILSGLRAAVAKNAFSGIPLNLDPALSVEGSILHRHIKACLITHPYLDHTAGLALISPNDTPKPIMGLQGVLDDLRDHIFNWRVWPNFSGSGAPPTLNKYSYLTLVPGETTPIPGTSMTVEAHPLAHGIDTDSTAFLIGRGGSFVLYMGDTGPDEIEGRQTTLDLWRRIAPLVSERRLRGIFIESSYPDGRPADQLFSHLTPEWILKSFRKLAALVDADNPPGSQSANQPGSATEKSTGESTLKTLSGLKVVITHIKPDLKSGTTPQRRVAAELDAGNDLGLDVVFARQGVRIDL